MIVAIDGLSGAGKTSVAKSLAKDMGCVCVRTGLLYRMVALNALDLYIDPDDEERVCDMLNALSLCIVEDGKGKFEYVINGYPVLKTQLFCEEVNASVKEFAKNPKIINFVEKSAQNIAERFPTCVVEGRNVCSNIVPNADIKFFLTASLEERVRRRQLQFSKHTSSLSQDEVLAQTCEADIIDKRNKKTMLSTNDVIVLDTTTMQKDEVVRKIKHGIETKTRENCFFRPDKQYQMEKFISEVFVKDQHEPKENKNSTLSKEQTFAPK